MEYIKVFSTLSEIDRTIGILHFIAVKYSCTSAVRLCYAKSDNSPFTCSHVSEFIGAKKLSTVYSSYFNRIDFSLC